MASVAARAAGSGEPVVCPKREGRNPTFWTERRRFRPVTRELPRVAVLTNRRTGHDV